jgi:O-antigen/teichoic acid export membrane protein
LGIVQKEGIRNTFIYYAGVILGYFNMTVLLPRALQMDQFGLIRFIFPFASILAFFYLLGIPNVIIRFFPHFKDEGKKHNGILFFAFSVVGASIVIVTCIFFMLKQPILYEYSKKAALFVQYYYVVFPLAIGFAVFEIFNAYNKSMFKTNFAVFINEVYVRVVVMILAIFYLMHCFSFTVFVYLFVAAYCSAAIIMLLYTLFNKTLFLGPSPEIFNTGLFKKMMNYGLFNFFGGATGMLIDKIDVLFIGGYLGLAETGIYGIAILMASSVALPAKALFQVLFPITADAFKNNDKQKLIFLYQSSCSNQLFVGSVVFMMVWVNFDSFFTIVHPAFLLAKNAFLILSIARLFDMATGINGLLIVNSKYYRYDLLFTSLLIGLTIICNQLFIPTYGLKGAATATAGSIILYNVVKYFFVWGKLKMQPFNLETIKITLTVILIFAVSYYLPQSGSLIFDMLYKTLVVSLLFLVSLLYLNINKEILKLLLNGFQKGKNLIPFRYSKKR